MNKQQANNVKPNQILWKIECLKLVTEKVYYQSTKKEKNQGIQFFIDVNKDNSGFRQLVTLNNLPGLFLTKKEAIEQLKKEIKEKIKSGKQEIKELTKEIIEENNKNKKEIKKLEKKLTKLH